MLFSLIGQFCELQKPVDIQVVEEVLGGGWDALHTQRADVAIGVNGEIDSGLMTLRLLVKRNWFLTITFDYTCNCAENAGGQIYRYPKTAHSAVYRQGKNDAR